MPNRHYLYVTNEGLRWYRVQGGQPQLVERFGADEAGFADFGRQLAAMPRRSRYSVLVDVPDEGFHFELLPSTRGRDREAMLGRKLAQQFYGSPYTASLALGREKQGRRDERVLLSALTRPAQLDPWIGALVSARVRVRGVHSVPFLLDRIMARARLPADAYLLVNFSPAGIRQTYFQGGRVRFSRLSGTPGQEFELSVAQAGEEVGRSLAYLAAQRMTRRGENLPVVGLLPGVQYEAFATAVDAATDADTLLADTGRLQGSYGAPESRGCGADSLPLLLNALGGEPQCLQIGGTEVLRFQRLHQIRKGLYLGALAILAGGAAIAGLGYLETRALAREQTELLALVQSENARHAALMRRLPPLPAPPDTLTHLVDELARVEQQRVPPLTVFQALSGALDQLPEITLESLEWGIDERETDGVPVDVAVFARLALPVGMSGDARAQLDASERFVRELARASGRPVRLVRRPVALQSNETLRGSEGRSAQSPSAASFEVAFTLTAEAGK
ncbi:MAG: hypothetical protein KDH20_20510 [Rhodocyclaceae bacterium]|nr:hypothetical protein [Rhodocyclaceae bacterium]